MSYAVRRWVWDQSGIGAIRKMVLLALVERANDDLECWPSISRLAKDTDLDRKTIMKSIKYLISEKLISVERIHGSVGRYRVLMPGQTSAKNGTGRVTMEAKTSTNFGTGLYETSPTFGTSTNFGTSTTFGTPTSTKCGTTPVPNVVHKPKKNPSLNPKRKHNTPNVVLCDRSSAQTIVTDDKQPRTTNPGSDGPHQGDSAKRTVKRAKKTPVDDWVGPAERSLELLEAEGIPRDFALSEVAEFREYWRERQERRAEWNATFRNRVHVQWDKAQQRMRSNKPQTKAEPESRPRMNRAYG